ncbi:probable ATP-dependent RNA helicase DDX56 [Oscarella lobularis]|uniref:probable ATP-dependent RNA helicase DDX56 n=1 Tax=Oscarella lobularis TaxID=121494 RepID=UPI00331377F2
MSVAAFGPLGLDDRLLKAVSRLGWSKTTPIQAKSIPLALAGKDVLVKAKTGSGKTAAYAIPIVQAILEAKKHSAKRATRALVLVPTKELCKQATKNLKELTMACSKLVRVVEVSSQSGTETLRVILADCPDIVVGTPSRVLAHLQAKTMSIKDSLSMLVIDEADLVFSFGYKDDLEALTSFLPKICQTFLISATLSEDVELLKKLVLHNPVSVSLDEEELKKEQAQLAQYHIRCQPDDKFLLLCALLKLKLLRGKTILFVNSVDRCYRLKLFMEQFGIPACLLNPELPQNSRCHVVDQFNRGVYDYIIASDEMSAPSDKSRKTKRKKSSDKEYGIARGIDFLGVENVLNFDLPTTASAYVHRVGRTARGMEYGSALSFVCSGEEEEILKKAEEKLSGGKDPVRPYEFDMAEIEGFRYRVNDALKIVTRAAVREARLKEIRTELLNSEKLKAHFQDNPRDLQVLRHDKNLHPTRVQQHLKNVPTYLVPAALKSSFGRDGPPSKKFYRKGQGHSSKAQKRKMDPLKSFKFTRDEPKAKKTKA